MKIQRISEINNFSIFKNFNWETNLTYQNNKGNNEVYDFKDINILYGRNYSGKTSLSKIIRSLEKQKLPLKYDNPDFKIKLSDDSEITHNTLQTFEHPIHVYNSDFVKENLKFIHNEDENLESFSVTLGGDNQQTLDCIEVLKHELGCNEENAESALYLAIKNKKNDLNNANKVHTDATNLLENYLKTKASGKLDSIRSQPNLFGDQDYNVGKLNRTDIPLVLSSGYQPSDSDKEREYRSIIDQRELANPPILLTYNSDFQSLITSTNDILKSVVGSSDKIDELRNNPSLNSWVQTGHPLHNNRSTCAFCNNEISDQRRKELANHFDEETDKLRGRISKGLLHLDNLLSNSQLNISFDMTNYYQQYYPELSQLQSNLQNAFTKQKTSIEMLKKALEDKDKKLFSALSIEHPQDYSTEIITILERISQIRTECIQKNDQLSSLQREAKNALRLDHIHHFLKSINYTQLKSDIELASQAIAPLENELKNLRTRKNTIQSKIEIEEAKLKSEGEACRRIKDILNHDFGHQTLSLEPIEITTTNGKEIKFEIQRNGIKAHNLSEGEQSLISFCYFLAKIQDDLDQNKKPILWIDDPICSLDNNHIYFIYSLLESLCLNNNYGQLFISTHNLDFLKYLTQLTAIGKTENTLKREKAFYQIGKTFTGSLLRKMTSHLQENSSEFIYLFDQIYKCSLAHEVDDSNHFYFYNFANNARKFLEIYTYYLFPNPLLKDRQRLQKFWGDRLPRIFSERINHDGSHAVTILEGKIILRDFSEVNTNAKLILAKLNASNPEQYNCLLESIGVSLSTQ